MTMTMNPVLDVNLMYPSPIDCGSAAAWGIFCTLENNWVSGFETHWNRASVYFSDIKNAMCFSYSEAAMHLAFIVHHVDDTLENYLLVRYAGYPRYLDTDSVRWV